MSDPTDRKETILWIDLIRVVAIYLVVVVHVSGQLTNVWGEIPTDQWILADIYGGIARMCVPLFFMISGYLLSSLREPGRFLCQADDEDTDPAGGLVTYLFCLVLRWSSKHLYTQSHLGFIA